MIYSLVAAMVIAVTPQATVNVIGPSSVPPGTMVILDGSKSISDFPVVWEVVPPEGTALFTFDQHGQSGVIAAFAAGSPGTYLVELVAGGWADLAKTKFAIAVDAKQITVGLAPPAPPPVQPQPTDPLGIAAEQFKKDVEAGWSAAYHKAGTAIGAGGPFGSTQAQLKEDISAAGGSAMNTNMAPWLAQLPPAGKEPTTQTQRTVLQQMLLAISGAFK